MLLKIEARVLDLWLDTSSGPNFSNYLFQARDLKVNFFQDFMILLNLCYDSSENKIRFVKIGDSVWDLWQDTSSGHEGPKHSFYEPDPKVKHIFEIS